MREDERAQATKQTNQPRVRAKGFAGFEEQWEEERNDLNRTTDLHKIPGRGNLELPVPDEEIPNLGGALRAFISWPISTIACFLGLPHTPATSAAAKSTLPKKIQGLATSATAKSTLPKNVQGPATECSELVIVPAIIRVNPKAF
nr:ulp1 protease family, C-terminal catalytic domain-containing protein [Tanacetum cinerariifolium]